MIEGSKNKGDWSELYVLLYLLGTGELYAADENLNKISNFHFPIKKIFRRDKVTHFIDYVVKESKDIEIYINKSFYKKMSSIEFKEEAKHLYEALKITTGQKVEISRSEAFMNSISLTRLAAPSTQVADISMEVHDTYTGIDQEMGYSIKSYIGSKPTLLNASEATNFRYEIYNISEAQMDIINKIDTREKIKDRIEAIQNFGGELKFDDACNNVFSKNLDMIDSRMKEIVAQALIIRYVDGIVKCKDIITKMEEEDPLGYDNPGIYVHKFKLLLCAKALGMEPSKKWSGDDEANGGYIVAKSDGDVLAFHLYNRDLLKKYLYEKTKFEKGSTSKHNFASIYKKDGKMYINLNLQIRFI